ncbi:hypothetical protein O0L34_g10051 [Tuta absoluta]|nr:hypothetical protein O0L34_g10051 [Tuta absoluta]
MNGQQKCKESKEKRDPPHAPHAPHAPKAPQKKSPEKNMSEIDEHILKRFDIKKRLGKGAYGIVWKAVDRKTKDTVAIKKIFDAFRNQTDAQRTFREITFLQAFRNHPNIVKLHSIHRASNNRDIYLGFEYMETDLHCVIKRGNILKDVHKRYIMYQILKATKYIHSGNVIHRDQKPSNVLIDSACTVKLADFGLARSVSSLYRGGGVNGSGGEDDQCLTDYVATRWYRAPEILIASKNYTKGIDMWSLGCILGEMLVGKPLFPGTSTVNQVECIMQALPRPSQEGRCWSAGPGRWAASARDADREAPLPGDVYSQPGGVHHAGAAPTLAGRRCPDPRRKVGAGLQVLGAGLHQREMLIGKPLFPGTSTVNQVECIMQALPRPSQEGRFQSAGPGRWAASARDAGREAPLPGDFYSQPGGVHHAGAAPTLAGR